VYSVCKIGQNVWDSRQLATISHFLYPTRELNLSEVALTKIRFIPYVILQALSGTCSQKWCIKAKGEHNWKTRSFISKPPGKQDLFEDFQPETHSFNIQLHVSRFLKHILRALPSQFAQPHQRQRGSDVEGLHLLCTARSCVRCSALLACSASFKKSSNLLLWRGPDRLGSPKFAKLWIDNQTSKTRELNHAETISNEIIIYPYLSLYCPLINDWETNQPGTWYLLIWISYRTRHIISVCSHV
jgi:hypothetical protein